MKEKYRAINKHLINFALSRNLDSWCKDEMCGVRPQKLISTLESSWSHGQHLQAVDKSEDDAVECLWQKLTTTVTSSYWVKKSSTDNLKQCKSVLKQNKVVGYTFYK